MCSCQQQGPRESFDVKLPADAAERVSAGIRVLIAITDVDSDVPTGSSIDKHAAAQTTSVLQIAEDRDRMDDATLHWPANRQ
jgi:hypothetical protein